MQAKDLYGWLNGLHEASVQRLLDGCERGDAGAPRSCWPSFAWEVTRTGSRFDRDRLARLALGGIRQEIATLAADPDASNLAWFVRPVAHAARRLAGHLPAADLADVLDYLRGVAEAFWRAPKCDREGNMGFLNFRALETELFIHLGLAARDDTWRERAEAYLYQLLPQHYPCGAIPYHTGAWIWGRKPATHYALTVVESFAAAAQGLGMEGARRVVRKTMEFYALVTDFRGIPMTTPFEHCAKAGPFSYIRQQFVLLEYARRLGAGGLVADAAGRALDRLLERLDDPGAPSAALETPVRYWAPEWTTASRILADLDLYGITDIPEYIRPAAHRIRRVFDDISTAVLHDPETTTVGTLLGGLNTPLAIQWGDLSLLGLGPEVTAQPATSHFGINCMDRTPWNINVELEDALASDEVVALRGAAPSRYFVRPGAGRERVCLPLGLCLLVCPRRIVLVVEPRDERLRQESDFHMTLMVDSRLWNGRAVRWSLGEAGQDLPEESCRSLPAGALRFTSPDTGKSLAVHALSPRAGGIVFQGTRCDLGRALPEEAAELTPLRESTGRCLSRYNLRKWMGKCLPRYHLTAWRFVFPSAPGAPFVFQVDLLERGESLPPELAAEALAQQAFTGALEDLARRVRP